MKKSEKSELLKHEKTLQKKETGREKNGEKGNKRSKWQIRRTEMVNYNSHSTAK